MRLAIITGADHAYFDLMTRLLSTLRASTIPLDFSLCVLDFGLLPEQIALARQHDADVIRPKWTIRAPDRLKTQHNLGYATRPMLPHCFPGFDMYLWLDADISVQDGSFVHAFVNAAEDGAIAIAAEVDPSYRIEAYALKWQIGNAFRCFGLWQGLKLCWQRPINSGVFALRADAPLWPVWQARYQQAVERAGRANLDQHALMAALYLDGMPCRYLDSVHNWICTRSQPLWDEERQVFCRPYAPFDPIAVLHLAGRDKEKLHEIRTTNGKTRRMRLSYGTVKGKTLDIEPSRA